MSAPPLRLLYVSHSFPPPNEPMANIGGMQRVATELFDALNRRSDVQLSPLVLQTSWRWTHMRTGPFLAKLLWRIPRLVAKKNIDVVLFSSMVTAALTPLLARRLSSSSPLWAAIAHGRDVTLPSALYQRLVPTVFEALDLVLPVSQATGKACQQRGLPSAKCQVVPNGVNPTRFKTVSSSDSQPSTRPAAASTLKLCSVGRQVKRKGFNWFVQEVMPQLPEHVHYYLAGDGPQQETIAQTARDQQLSHRVHLLGKIPEEELLELYQTADLFVMPNIPVAGDMEGFGVVMLEAGICGTPVIASRLEGIQDVITDGANGHLVQPADAQAFVRQINYYLTNPDALQKAAQQAAQHTRQTFTWSAVANQYVNVLRQQVRPAVHSSSPPLTAPS